MATAFVFEPTEPDRRPDLRLVDPAPTRRPRHLVPTRLVVLLVAVATALVVMTAVQADQPAVTEEYVVEAGDTLWVIAGDLTPAGGDIRASIHTISELNDLGNSALRPGQILLLPAG